MSLVPDFDPDYVAPPDEPADGAADETADAGGFPVGLVRGSCRICGEAADSERSTYCKLHRPKKPSGKKDPRPKAPRSPGRPSTLAAELTTQFQMIAQLWGFADPECAGALMAGAPALGDYWANQAETSPRVKAFIVATSRGGGVIGAIAVHAPIAIAIFGHHIAPRIQARQQQLTDFDDGPPEPGAYGEPPEAPAAPWNLAETDPAPPPDAVESAPWPPAPRL